MFPTMDGLVDLFIVSSMYNGIMLCFVGLAIWAFSRKKGEGSWATCLFGLAAVALMTSLVFCLPDSNPLRAARLLCYGWFVHLPIFLAASAIISNRRFVRIGSTAVLGLTAVVVFDAFCIEPFQLEVTHYEVKSPKVAQSFKIVLLADYQTDKFGVYERECLSKIMQERPDAIFMAGDYLQSESDHGWEQLRDATNAFLRKIEFGAPQGVYGVGGNTDFHRWPEIFAGCEIKAFQETRTIAGSKFTVTGLSVEDSFDARLSLNRCTDAFHIVIGHAPDFSLSDSVDADLLLAGHTHGGQVRLPFIGPLVTFSRVPRSWAAGLTHLNSSSKLIVSRGVGMERRDAPRLRFLCRPELVVINVTPNG